MFTLFTFTTVKCMECNKQITFQPGVYNKPLQPDCDCLKKLEEQNKPKRGIKDVNK